MTYPLDWLKGSSVNVRKMRALLKDVLKWRKRLRNIDWLGTGNEYDWALGCLGNPNSDVVLIAEIPNMSKRFQSDCEEKGPKGMDPRKQWNWSPADEEFRKALNAIGLIPKKDDDPLKWNVWITDFVKVPARRKEWSERGKRDPIKSKILQQSSVYIKRELDIIEPRIIGMIGGWAHSYMTNEMLGRWRWWPRVHIRHYAYKKDWPVMREGMETLGRWLESGHEDEG